MTAARDELKAVSAQLDQQRTRLRECDREIGALVKSRDQLNKQLADANVDRKKIEYSYASVLCCDHKCSSSCFQHVKCYLARTAMAGVISSTYTFWGVSVDIALSAG